MRYAKGHKEDTRKRILKVAGERFRRDGIEAAGVVPIMKEAGLTHGGFYAHFASKEALVAETVKATMAESTARLLRAVERAGPGQGLAALLDSYLTPAHRDAPASGCLAAAVAGELSRAGDATREAFEQGFRDMVDVVERQLDPSLAGDERQRRAWAITSMMVGAVTLSRATVDRAVSDQMLRAARDTALAIAGA